MIRPGSWVVCVDARQSGGALRAGEVYRVAARYGSFISIEAGPKMGWYSYRFRPAPDISSLRALLRKTASEKRAKLHSNC